MSVIAKVLVPAVDLPSNGVLATDGGETARLERVIRDGEQLVPYFWVENGRGPETLDDLGEAGWGTAAVVDELDEETLVKVELSADEESLFHKLARTEAEVLQARTDDDSWRLQLAFPDHETFVGLYRWCIERDISIEVDRVHDPDETRSAGSEFALTPTQRETLLTAFRRGYFDVPREVNLVGLAEEFDISDTAVSQRLRRGIATLVATTLVESEEPASD